MATTYLQISAAGIGKGFEKGDGVKITVDSIEGLSNVFVNTEEDGKMSTNTYIVDKTDDTITIIGIIDKAINVSNNELTIERKVPDMAFITECNNRLWGCSKDGHEIYCCKLGDPKNWNCFMGLSTDSYAASCGTDGQWTGAITHLGYPLFFKENCMHKVYGSYPANYQIQTTACRGVQKGCERSLAIVNEVLYYNRNNRMLRDSRDTALSWQ